MGESRLQEGVGKCEFERAPVSQIICLLKLSSLPYVAHAFSLITSGGFLKSEYLGMTSTRC